MNELNHAVFIDLFKKACAKCFGHPLTAPLSDADSRLLSGKILEDTGLVIGAKSVRNYSLFVLGHRDSKKENPSIATLDTLARYVLSAPYIDETARKEKEGHYPYWFQYKSGFSAPPSKQPKHTTVNWRLIIGVMVVAIVTAMGVFVIKASLQKHRRSDFTDHFNVTSADSLQHNGWFIKLPDTLWWSRHTEKPGCLTLYTLTGDNWPNADNPVGIRNLVARAISSDCFVTEAHLAEFYPSQNWQQAGILLSEDSVFSNKVLRVSISYNDFFGGYEKPPEIIIQALSSSESGDRSRPEEIAHLPVFSVEPGQEDFVRKNLKRSALKIEKQGNHFRFLYTVSEQESFAFKEVVSGDFNIQPRYIGLFAIQGFVNNASYIPAHFDSFSFMDVMCDE